MTRVGAGARAAWRARASAFGGRRREARKDRDGLHARRPVRDPRRSARWARGAAWLATTTASTRALYGRPTAPRHSARRAILRGSARSAAARRAAAGRRRASWGARRRRVDARDRVRPRADDAERSSASSRSATRGAARISRSARIFTGRAAGVRRQRARPPRGARPSVLSAIERTHLVVGEREPRARARYAAALPRAAAHARAELSAVRPEMADVRSPRARRGGCEATLNEALEFAATNPRLPGAGVRVWDAPRLRPSSLRAARERRALPRRPRARSRPRLLLMLRRGLRRRGRVAFENVVNAPVRAARRRARERAAQVRLGAARARDRPRSRRRAPTTRARAEKAPRARPRALAPAAHRARAAHARGGAAADADERELARARRRSARLAAARARRGAVAARASPRSAPSSAARGRARRARVAARRARVDAARRRGAARRPAAVRAPGRRGRARGSPP